MRYLLARARWDTDRRARTSANDLRGYVTAHLGGTDADLVVDETGDLKKGSATVGVQRRRLCSTTVSCGGGGDGAAAVGRRARRVVEAGNGWRRGGPGAHETRPVRDGQRDEHLLVPRP
jgi:DDE superfamily endonuclease